MYLIKTTSLVMNLKILLQEAFPAAVQRMRRRIRCTLQGARDAVVRVAETIRTEVRGDNERDCRGYRDFEEYGCTTSQEQQRINPAHIIVATGIAAAAGLLLHSVISNSRSRREN